MSQRNNRAMWISGITVSYLLATVAALAADPATVTMPLPLPKQISTSNFIHATSLPWQTVCEWSDVDGKYRNSRTDGLDRPSEATVPKGAMCAAFRRFAFPNGRSFSEAHVQKAHPTPVQVDRSTNFVYIASGHGYHMVDGKTMDSEPGDAFVQAVGKSHQTTALSDDYIQIGIPLPKVDDGDGLKTSEADLARGNLIHHKDAPKSDVCFIGYKDGAVKVVVRTPANAASIPADVSCFTVYSLLARPGGAMVEVFARKGSKSLPHHEELDTIIYYVKGRVQADIDGEVQEMKAGDAVLHPGGVLHADEFLADTIQLEIKYPKTTKSP